MFGGFGEKPRRHAEDTDDAGLQQRRVAVDPPPRIRHLAIFGPQTEPSKYLRFVPERVDRNILPTVRAVAVDASRGVVGPAAEVAPPLGSVPVRHSATSRIRTMLLIHSSVAIVARKPNLRSQ